MIKWKALNFILTIFIMVLVPNVVSVVGKESSNATNIVPLRPQLILDNTTKVSGSYLSSVFYVSSNISISTDVNFIGCFFFFLFNSTSSKRLGFVISNQSVLTIENSLINFIIANSSTLEKNYFFIYGMENSHLNFIQSKISKAELSSELHRRDISIFYSLKFTDFSKILFNNSVVDDCSNLFSISHVQDILFINSIFYNVSANFLNIDSSPSVIFENNTFFANSSTVTSSFSILNVKNLSFKGNTFKTDVSNPSKLIVANLDYFIENKNISQLSFINNSVNYFQNFCFFQNINSVALYNNSITNSLDFILSSKTNEMYISMNDFQNISDFISILEDTTNSNVTSFLNNFINVTKIVSFINQSSNTTKFFFSFNYYSNFKPFDLNVDGISEKPYKTNYFIDYYPLVYPFENYSFYNGIFALNDKSIYGYQISLKDLTYLNYQWFYLWFYYIMTILITIFLLLKTFKR